jgi:hypothetical protein
MENVKNYSSFIKRLVTTQPQIRKKMLTTSNLNIIKAICEIILNIYYKQIPLSESALKELKKNKAVLLQLISPNRKGGLSSKRELLIKHSDSFIAIKEIFQKQK